MSNKSYSPNLQLRGVPTILIILALLVVLIVAITIYAHQQITGSSRNLERDNINALNAVNKITLAIDRLSLLQEGFVISGNGEKYLQNSAQIINQINNDLEKIKKGNFQIEQINSFQENLININDLTNQLIRQSKTSGGEDFELKKISAQINLLINATKNNVSQWDKKFIDGYLQESAKTDEKYTQYTWLFIAFLFVTAAAVLYTLVVVLSKRRNYRNIVEEVYSHIPTGLPNIKQLREDFQTNMEAVKNAPLYLLLIDIKATEIMVQTEGEGEYNQAMAIIRDRVYDSAQKEMPQSGLYRYREGMFALIGANTTLDKVVEVCKNILAKLQKSLEIGGQVIRIYPGIGVVAYPENANDFDELIHHGLIALTYCKAEELRNYIVFENDVEDNRRQRLAVTSNLRHSLINNEFKMFYQPRKNCLNNEISAFEAFIRWNTGNVVYPAGYFLPLARSSGLEAKLDYWVLQKVGAQLQSWRNQDLPEVTVAINISAMSLQEEDFINKFIDWLHQYKIYPQQLIVEFSKLSRPEFGSVAILAIINALEKLHEIGVKIAIDDFGSQQYSFADLVRYPLDIVKIDSQFVRNISHNYNPQNEVLDPQSAWTKALISMAQQLNLIVVGEGVETLTQNSLLTLWGCSQIQGNFYCPIIDENKIVDFIRKNQNKINSSGKTVLVKPIEKEESHFALDLVL